MGSRAREPHTELEQKRVVGLLPKPPSYAQLPKPSCCQTGSEGPDVHRVPFLVQPLGGLTVTLRRRQRLQEP